MLNNIIIVNGGAFVTPSASHFQPSLMFENKATAQGPKGQILDLGGSEWRVTNGQMYLPGTPY